MAAAMQTFRVLFLASLFCLLQGTAESATFRIKNSCNMTIWPATLAGGGVAPLNSTGFSLFPGEVAALQVPPDWSGRVWARTHCSSLGAEFSCLSGDCGTGTVACSGAGGSPPATLAEFTLRGAGGRDFYDASLVDGFNLALRIEPEAEACNATGCAADMNRLCPLALRHRAGEEVIGCVSPCLAFKRDEYCCTGAYGDPRSCKGTEYSEVFKKACPQAYSFPYDDASSTFTCAGADAYFITFCPSP